MGLRASGPVPRDKHAMLFVPYSLLAKEPSLYLTFLIPTQAPPLPP